MEDQDQELVWTGQEVEEKKEVGGVLSVGRYIKAARHINGCWEVGCM